MFSKPVLPIVLFVCTILLTCLTLWSAPLQPYVITDPNDEDPYGTWKMPGTPGGNFWDPNTQVNNVQPGQVVWLAFKNTHRLNAVKILTLTLRKTGGSGSVGRLEPEFPPQGFDDPNSLRNHPGDDVSGNGSISIPSINKHVYRWKPQPAWERIKLKNKGPNPVSFSIDAKSDCFDCQTGQKYCCLEGASFGATDAMAYKDTITTIAIFPDSVAVDTAITPLLTSYPPGSGNWTPAFVYTDPNGDSRPLGGIQFVTDGNGLDAGELFDLYFEMTSDPDVRYQMYTYGSAGLWDEYWVILDQQGPCDGYRLDADINYDCVIDLEDLALFSQYWLESVIPPLIP